MVFSSILKKMHKWILKNQFFFLNLITTLLSILSIILNTYIYAFYKLYIKLFCVLDLVCVYAKTGVTTLVFYLITLLTMQIHYHDSKIKMGIAIFINM